MDKYRRYYLSDKGKATRAKRNTPEFKAKEKIRQQTRDRLIKLRREIEYRRMATELLTKLMEDQ